MSNPRRSAQREYMRNIISAQSWASVPPAPAWISATASRSSWSPANNARSSREPSRRSRSAKDSSTSGRRESSPSSSFISKRVSASDRRAAKAASMSMSSLIRPSSVVTLRALSASSHRSGADAAASSSTRRFWSRSSPRKCSASRSRSVVDAIVARMSTRSGSPPPRRGGSAAAISVSAVAELVLLPAATPTRVVATHSFLVGFHDGNLGFVVFGEPVGHPTGPTANTTGPTANTTGPTANTTGRFFHLRRRGPGRKCGRHRPAPLHRVIGGDIAGLGEVRLGGGLGHDLHVEDVTEVIVIDAGHQLPEHLEAVPLPCHQWVLITHGPQVDAFPQEVHFRQMVTPSLVEDLQHDVPLELACRLLPAGGRLVLLGVEVERLGEDALGHLTCRGGLGQVLFHKLGGVVLGDLSDQTGQVPLFGVVGRARGGDQTGDGGLEQFLGFLVQILSLDDLQAALVDHLALLVHNIVVLEHVLARFGVATLDRVLRPLDGLGHHFRLDGDVVGNGPTHDPVHGAGGKEAHQVVFERKEEPTLPRVTLATRTTSKLIVDSPALVPFAT